MQGDSELTGSSQSYVSSSGTPRHKVRSSELATFRLQVNPALPPELLPPLEQKGRVVSPVELVI